MITYELAKQLKDAGFPQDNTYDERTTFIDEYAERFGDELNEEYNPCKIPTLSELIEACGDNFGALFLSLEWRSCGSKDNVIEPFEGFGSSPEEAVAKLWLELNNK